MIKKEIKREKREQKETKKIEKMKILWSLLVQQVYFVLFLSLIGYVTVFPAYTSHFEDQWRSLSWKSSVFHFHLLGFIPDLLYP